MDKYVVWMPRKRPVEPLLNVNVESEVDADVPLELVNQIDDEVGVSNEKRDRKKNDCDTFTIVSDPAPRLPIDEYDHLVRDNILRAFVIQGLRQPYPHNFPKTKLGNKLRCFRGEWFKKWEWLEYIVSKDLCFWCYLFGGERENDVFVKKEFRNWS